MANYKVTDSELSGIASAIRLKGGTSDPLVFPSGFVSAISAIETQGTYISKMITSNGEYDPASDNADAFSHVTVSVPTGSSPVLVSKSISENGTYNPADDNADAYSQVVVNVSSGGGGANINLITRESGTIYDNAVTKIGEYALQSYSGLSAIEMTEVSIIGRLGVAYCSDLEYASFPNCTYISMYGFRTCSKLSKITLGSQISLSTCAFESCGLLDFDFTGLSFVPNGCFRNTKLQSVNAPVCEIIDAYAFLSCGLLETVSLNNCTEIRSEAFRNCIKLENVSFPNIESIGDSVFSGCLKLKSVSLLNCKTIAFNAFVNCNLLESIYLLTESVCSLYARNAFYNTPISNSSYLGRFGSIYVPTSLVDAYKSATNWSYYSDRITAYVEE